MEENINNASVETVETTEQQEVKTYTQDEVLKLLQSETDKRVTAALKTQQKKYEKQLSLSKLDGSERGFPSKPIKAGTSTMRGESGQFTTRSLAY